MKTWWRKGLDVGFNLMSIGYRVHNLKTEIYPHIDGLPDDLTMDIKKLSVDDHDCIEEQLWSFRQNLS